MKSISLCLIVKDEEKTLERCLCSILSIADEIIIVDTGSKDKTKHVAKKFTPYVYDFVWNKNFSEARNFCQNFATKELIFWMDADNYFLKWDERILQNYINAQDLDILNLYEKWTLYQDAYKLRIFKKSLWLKWIWEIHEILDISYKTERKINFYSLISLQQKSTEKYKFWDDYNYFEELINTNKGSENSILYLRLIQREVAKKEYEKALKIVEKLKLIHHFHLPEFLNFTKLQKWKINWLLEKNLKKKIYLSFKYWESKKFS